MRERLVVLGLALVLALTGAACEGGDEEEEDDFAAPVTQQL